MNMDEVTTTQTEEKDEKQENIMIVGGFQFENRRDAQTALREQKNIELLKSKIDFNQTQDMISLYQRLVEKKVFKTPIGYQFLGEFRDYLSEEQHVDTQNLPYIYVEPGKGMSRTQQEQMEFLQSENRTLEAGRKKHLIIIAVLVFMIVAMFIITILNPNVGYINTENKILNRYAGWEEELKEREANIRQREEELGITNNE